MMKNIQVDTSAALSREQLHEAEKLTPKIEEALALIHTGRGAGSDFLGWVDLPESISETETDEIIQIARSFSGCDFVVCIGIGGSYLGCRAVTGALENAFAPYCPKGNHPQLLFAGNQLSTDYLYELRNLLQNKNFGIINISKSGTTTEPAVAFRFLRALLEGKVGREGAKELIVAVTDGHRGALHTMAEEEGFRTCVIPDNIGGRFSVLSPVGLLPIAVAGYDIRALLRGAGDMRRQTAPEVCITENPAARYAAARYQLYQAGKKIEILGSFNPKLFFLGEWWKQLFGESEGKQGKGLFNAAVNFTTDLHSLGQWIQEGERTIFETIISVGESEYRLEIPAEEKDLDGLNYLSGRTVEEINRMAELGTRMAHIDGGVPNIRIELPKIDEYYLGQLIYFFEKSVAISGYMIGVNPFDQPGVEAYKNNMFALLGKTGYEQIGEQLKKRLK